MTIEQTSEQRARVEEFQRRHRIVLLTLLFTDVVGSTRLKQVLGERAAIELTERHHALLREILARFPDAEEIDTAGDSFFMVFAKPSDAVQFALLAQRAVRELARETGQPVLDRIGIHVGEVFIQDRGGEGRNLFGIQIDSTARIMSLGSADQILLSRFAFDNARLVLRGFEMPGIGELSWLNHGYYELKGVEEPLEVCEVGEAGLATLTPPSDSEKAHRFHAADAEPVLGWRPAAGQLVPNTQWVLDRPLGEGGFGEVWLARHQTLKDRRVFKFCFNAEKARSLKREVTLFRVLREHVGPQPGIVAVHDVYFDQPPYYIVMDHIDGPTLTGWAEAHAPLDAVPLETRLEIVAQIADALQTAHDAGVIHRDVKPSNILVAEEAGAPRAMLTDFGIGQLISNEALAGITQLGFTQTLMAADSMTGTQLYLAPELLSGHSATIRSDIYALGIVLYQLVTGALNRPLTSDWADDISDSLLREDIRNCVAGDPAKRFAGGAQLSANLRGLPQRRAEKESVERLLVRTARRKKQMRLVSFAAAAVTIAAAIFGFAFLRERDLKLKVAQEGRRAEAGEAKATKALDDLRRQAPALRQLVESEAGFQRFDSALDKLDAALALDPAHLPSYWRRAWLFIGMDRLPEAAAAIRLAQQKDPAHGELAAILPTIETLAALSPTERWPAEDILRVRDQLVKVGASGELVAISGKLALASSDKAKLIRQRLNLWLGKEKGKVGYDRSGLILVNLTGLPIDTIEPLRGLPIDKLEIYGTNVSDLEPLHGMRLVSLSTQAIKVSDLSAVRGMPLSRLDISYTKITELSPLSGVPLQWLSCDACGIVDFSALRGAPLKTLFMANNHARDLNFLSDAPLEELQAYRNKITDLSALRGKPLTKVNLRENNVTDFSPLRGTPIEELELHRNPQIKDLSPLLDLPKLEKLRVSKLGKRLEPLRAHPSLKYIAYDDEAYRPVAEFWAEYDAQQAAEKK